MLQNIDTRDATIEPVEVPETLKNIEMDLPEDDKSEITGQENETRDAIDAEKEIIETIVDNCDTVPTIEPVEVIPADPIKAINSPETLDSIIPEQAEYQGPEQIPGGYKV